MFTVRLGAHPHYKVYPKGGLTRNKFVRISELTPSVYDHYSSIVNIIPVQVEFRLPGKKPDRAELERLHSAIKCETLRNEPVPLEALAAPKRSIEGPRQSSSSSSSQSAQDGEPCDCPLEPCKRPKSTCTYNSVATVGHFGLATSVAGGSVKAPHCI